MGSGARPWTVHLIVCLRSIEMKRSLCLSALLAGLSLTTATAALAAPPTATEGQPIRKVAQAQDPTPSTGTPTSPAPASEDGSSSTTPQPAVSVGTSTTAPTADTPATSAPEPAKKPAPRPFAGSALFVMNSMTTGTVFKGQTQDYNPTVESAAIILPRYAINDAFQLRGRVVASYEYTNSDSTTYRNEPTLSDSLVQVFYRKIPKLPLGIQPAVALNVTLPTSKAARARTNIFSPGATLQLVRGFDNILGGELLLLSNVTYTHPIYSSRNPEVTDPRPAGAFSCVGGNNCSDLLSGTMNPSDQLTYSLIAVMEWGHWSPALMYLGGSQWVYQPREVSYNGVPVGRPEGFEPTSVRQTHYFSAWLDYNFNSWLTGEIGYWNSQSALTGAAQRSNVVFNRYGDSRVYLGASIQLDNLVKAIQGGEHGEAGVVRAKNNKQPMWTF
ncbi:MAG: hypothetical protein K0S65_599 [Labilithrix sp.]|nr:hypothetical protein [Labilithrix sp.]